MGIVQSLEYLVDVELAIAWLDGVEDGLIVGLVDVFEDEAVDFALLHDVQQFDGALLAVQRHQDLHLPIDLLELD